MGFLAKPKAAKAESPVKRPPPSIPLLPSPPGAPTGPPSSATSRLRRRLLFVESDPAAPEQFNRILQHRSQSWEVAGATTAAEALACLEHNAFDGVISSARLPDRNGVEFLNELARRFPNVVRLIRYAPEDKPLLRGFAGWPPSHLTRDMDQAEIECGLNGAFQIAEWMGRPAMKALLPRMQRLPAVPELYTRVIDLLADPATSTDDIGRLIAQDPALTVKMLQMVNSAAFALARPVSSAVEAVQFLGTERIKALILVASTALNYDLSECGGFSQDQFWHHSLGVASLARSIAQMERMETRLADESFTAGLLHDIGKLLLAANLPQKYSQMLSVARHQRLSDEQAERLEFGTSHAELGACLLGTWGLPLELLCAISSHHAPSDSGEGTFSLLTAVHVANSLDHCRSGVPEDGNVLGLDHRYLAHLGLTDRWGRWRELVDGRALAA